MRITGSDISLAAASQRVHYQQQTTAVRVTRAAADERPGPQTPPRSDDSTAHETSKPTKTRRPLWEKDPLLARYIDLLERTFGVKVKILDPDDLTAGGASEVLVRQAEALGARSGPSLAITVDITHTRYESEQVEFSAAGRLTTSDGRTIDLELQSRVSREYLERSHTRMTFGDAPVKDPLVLNLDGLPASLDEAQIEFDLDADGQLDRFHVLGGGSAYLSWDRNGDGIVNDGSELFGPQTGNGFSELAAHDGDGNRWIDEADAIWTQLRLWQPSTEGPGTATGLSAAEIGAIYLGSVATPFTLTPGSSEQARGDVRSTGLFLHEDGTPGTVQQLDLRV
jgi:hypothetical protein